MKTPTPEDIALAQRIDDEIPDAYRGEQHPNCIDVTNVAQLIADHCAALREEVHSLKASQKHLKGIVFEVGKLTRRDKSTESTEMSVERIAELAEIGRLAVELFQVRQSNLWQSYTDAVVKVDTACAAYLEKARKATLGDVPK